MKFKVGDKVKVINCKVAGRECENLGKIFTIKSTDKNGNRFPYELYGTPEFFGDNELELVNKFTKSDLKDGDIVTYRNGNRRLVNATKQEIVYIENTSWLSFNFHNFRDDLTNKDGKEYDIVKVERSIQYETMFERKEEILDETEKRYLTSVIRPFRNEFKNISKKEDFIMKGKEYLRIDLKNDDYANFPSFEKGTMYKGMKEDKEYTLKELGL